MKFNLVNHADGTTSIENIKVSRLGGRTYTIDAATAFNRIAASDKNAESANPAKVDEKNLFLDILCFKYIVHFEALR